MAMAAGCVTCVKKKKQHVGLAACQSSELSEAQPKSTSEASSSEGKGKTEMVLRRAAAAAGECPKNGRKVSAVVDLVNLSMALREFAGGRSQMSHLTFFLRI